MPKVIEHTQTYIPDTSHAESWLTPDVFKYKGQSYRVMPDMKVVKLPANGKKGETVCPNQE